MKSLFYLALILLLNSSFKEKEDIYVSYPKEVSTLENCPNSFASIMIKMSTNSKKRIKVHSFNMHVDTFHMLSNDTKVGQMDTLYLSSKNPIHLSVHYKVRGDNSFNIFRFETNNKKHRNNLVKVVQGEVAVTTEDFRNGCEKVINISKSCKDSVSIRFPYAGTFTGITVYKAASLEKEMVQRHLGYMFLDGDNAMKFSKRDTGKYEVNMNSCHWSGDFTLNLK